MPGDDVYGLYIDASPWRPSRWPVWPITWRDFAEMLGHPEHVHFDKLKAGSLSLATARRSRGAEQSRPPQSKRFAMAVDPSPHSGPSNPWTTALPKTMRSGGWCIGSERCIEFAGRNRIVEKSTGPIEQADTLVGEVIQIGGRDETINIHLKMGDDVFNHCITSKAVARRLAHHLFSALPSGCVVPASGRERNLARGACIAFPWTDFEPLDATSLPTLVPASARQARRRRPRESHPLPPRTQGGIDGPGGFDNTILSVLLFPDADLREGAAAVSVDRARERVDGLVQELAQTGEQISDSDTGPCRSAGNAGV